LVDGDAAAALRPCDAERLLLEQLLEIDLEVLAGGVDASLDFNVGVVAVPVERPNAFNRSDTQQRQAGRAREKFSDLQ